MSKKTLAQKQAELFVNHSLEELLEAGRGGIRQMLAKLDNHPNVEMVDVLLTHMLREPKTFQQVVAMLVALSSKKNVALLKQAIATNNPIIIYAFLSEYETSESIDSRLLKRVVDRSLVRLDKVFPLLGTSNLDLLDHFFKKISRLEKLKKISKDEFNKLNGMLMGKYMAFDVKRSLLSYISAQNAEKEPDQVEVPPQRFDDFKTWLLNKSKVVAEELTAKYYKDAAEAAEREAANESDSNDFDESGESDDSGEPEGQDFEEMEHEHDSECC